MRNALAVLLVAAAALACRGRSAPAQRSQQQYDVIQEGQTTSATSTIDAPGEVRPPASTATNTDTTGTFALGTATPPPNMPGGPAGGVLPPQQPGAMSSGVPMPAPAMPPRPRERRPPPLTVTTTTSSDTNTAPTDTAATDTTSAEKPRKTGTAPPPPPPPTVTDTIGH